jgi:hypothetical protein
MTLCAAVALLALAAPPAGAALQATPAGPLAELAAALERLGGAQTVRVRVEHRYTFSQGDEPPRPEGQIWAMAETGPHGLKVTWDGALLADADREERQLVTDPDAPSPVRDALFDLRTLTLAHVLDAAPELLRTLRGAELLEARDEEKDGVPARLLVLKVTPPLGARERKYVKEVAATARVWLGPDGLPVASEQEISAKGRAFLVITFDIDVREKLRFGREGDRLVVLHRESEQRSSGAGERSWRRSVTDLTVQR